MLVRKVGQKRLNDFQGAEIMALQQIFQLAHQDRPPFDIYCCQMRRAFFHNRSGGETMYGFHYNSHGLF